MDNRDNNNDNILKFPYRNKITDADITSLFLGLCRLVKNKALEEAKLLVDGEMKKNRELSAIIAKKNKEIEMLRLINFELKKKIDKNIENKSKLIFES